VPTLAFCPCAPVLVPEVAQGAAPETADVLAACDAAISWLTAGGDDVVVVGAGSRHDQHGGSAVGTLSGLGVPVTAGGSGDAHRDGRGSLPLALTMGAWLLDRAGVAAARRSYLEVRADGSATVAAATLTLPDAAPSWLVMGDGTARLSERAPGGLDQRAAAYDAVVLDALSSGDPHVLAALDPRDGAELMAAGVPVWRAVGAALLANRQDRRWDARLTSHVAPYGVSYVVATWS
jgi:hypothetical protein